MPCFAAILKWAPTISRSELRSEGASGRKARRSALAAAALIALVCLPGPAPAEEGGADAFRFLRPWIERQLFGHETSRDAAQTPSTPAPLSDERAPDRSLASEHSAAGASESVPTRDESGIGLRGSQSPADVMRAREEPTEDGGPGSNAAALPGQEADEPSGVPVEAKPEALRFAVLAGRSVATTMAMLGPVADELQTILGRPVEILPLASYDAMVEAQVTRRIDGGFYSAAAFAAADTACFCLEPLVAPKASDGTIAYHAIIVARAGGGIASPADLAGKTIAMTADESLGSRRLQLAGLLSEEIDPAEFGSVITVESAESAVRLAAAGRADAAFAWSSLAGDLDTGYSRGTLTQLVGKGEIAMRDLVVVWSSPPVVHGPFAVLRTLPEADKQRIESYLSALSAGNPAAYDLLDPFYGGGYAAVEPRDYAGLETLLSRNVEAIRLPRGPEMTGANVETPTEPPSPGDFTLPTPN